MKKEKRKEKRRREEEEEEEEGGREEGEKKKKKRKGESTFITKPPGVPLWASIVKDKLHGLFLFPYHLSISLRIKIQDTVKRA